MIHKRELYRAHLSIISLLLLTLIFYSGETACADTIQLKQDGGTLSVPITINKHVTLDFLIDSGASDVTLTPDIVLTLIRSGTITSQDFLPEKTYTLADGSKIKNKGVLLRSVKVGKWEVYNVIASIGGMEGALLLGQSFLSKIPSWKIDNRRMVMEIDEHGMSSVSGGARISADEHLNSSSRIGKRKNCLPRCSALDVSEMANCLRKC